MSQEAYDKYQELTLKVFEIRSRGLSEKETDALEDPILEEQDDLWWAMTEQEQDKMDAWLKEKRKKGELP